MNWNLKKISELTIEELYKILKLRSEVFVVEQQCVYQDCDGKDESSYHLYLEDKGEIVAYLRILPRKISYEEMSIGRVVVKKSYRGQSVASEMLKKAIEFIEEKLNQMEIRISAQAHLINFYGSFGFKAVTEEYLEDGIPHIEMLYKK
ncbi:MULTISPECIES: GNAT family N-acetyltransferase [Clostridium]|uniref:GNAT family N-acetyltransferase n=1 Tax=Clostridium cibarium TaxID=2762247 RepID=A0ABR8PSZ7_9CLOT|nr:MULTISPECIES: GNAT family N-acetyltransferase [Clostridium]MBD7911292.1 GNAT family N-acetyltransferase [Clostridium cibarium]